MDLAGLVVYVDDPEVVANAYATRLGFERTAVVVSEGRKSSVILVSAEGVFPCIAIAARRGDDGRSFEPADVPSGPGVRRMIFATRDFETDDRAFESRALGQRRSISFGTGREVRVRSASVPLVGMAVDLVESASDVRTNLLAVCAASLGLDRFDGFDVSDISSPPSSTPSMLDHMAVGVTDSKGAFSVLSDVLGFRVFEENVIEHESGAAHVHLVSREPPHGFALAIGFTNAGPDHPFRRQIDARGGPGPHHVAHRVVNLETALARVKDAGGTVLSAIEESAGLRQAFVSVAEEGLVHELVERSGVHGFVAKNTTALVDTESRWSTPTGSQKAD